MTDMNNQRSFYLGEGIAVGLSEALGDRVMLGEGAGLEVVRQLRGLVGIVGGKEQEHSYLGGVGLPEELLQEVFGLEGEVALGVQTVVMCAMAQEIGATAKVMRDVREGLEQDLGSVGDRVGDLDWAVNMAGDNLEIVVGLGPRLQALNEKVRRGAGLQMNVHRLSYSLLRTNLKGLGSELGWFGEKSSEMVEKVSGDDKVGTEGVLLRLAEWREQLGGLGLGAS